MSIKRFAARRDTSEKAIVDALEAVGAQVLRLEVVDLLVLFRARLHLLECKTGKAPLKPSQRELLERGWPLSVVRTPEEALQAIGAMR